jgi:hypothetical protein
MMAQAQAHGVVTGDWQAAGAHLTFKGNRRDTRYGWLRLTPAYSLVLVDELVKAHDGGRVLDPFCGTGTTALVCGQRDLECVTADINPFLVWLTETKAAAYGSLDLAEFDVRAAAVADAIDAAGATAEWLPALHQIDKWWDEATLHGLGRAMAAIRRTDSGSPADNLLRIVFCRSAIERAAVSFGHQSMSFRRRVQDEQLFLERDLLERLRTNWCVSAASVRDAAATTDVPMQPEVLLLDARCLRDGIEEASIARVITSPPYPNRMSYIRELRPYLYWLGYLSDAKEAGELDWKAIGGTWGTATSRVSRWTPTDDRVIAYEPFLPIVEQIAQGGANGPLLSRYVHKYFFDMVEHIDQLFAVMEPGATAHYIVGNSKFYDTLLPVQDIYAAMFAAGGFEDIRVRAFRKRSSKKELFEYLVEGRRPLCA